MKGKVLLAVCIIVAGMIAAFIGFMDSYSTYGDFSDARRDRSKIQVKGTWVRDRGGMYDAKLNQFTFFLKDENGEVVKVILTGRQPDNFYTAENVVVKGKMAGEYFHATDILTKCPSKYEGKIGRMKKEP